MKHERSNGLIDRAEHVLIHGIYEINVLLKERFPKETDLGTVGIDGSVLTIL